MSTQLPLPASWAVFESRRDPRERLATLHRDTATAYVKIRSVVHKDVRSTRVINERDATRSRRRACGHVSASQRVKGLCLLFCERSGAD
jgi:hypothetical protein